MKRRRGLQGMASSSSGSAGGGRGLSPSSAYSAGLHASGYHTPDLATRSSSPGSGSFHTANPMDSERSSLTGHSDGEEWERERRDELSSVEIPALDEGHTPLASYQGQIRADIQEEDVDVTLRNSPSPPLAALTDREANRGRGEEGRNWINQPKLVPAESEAVPPCPRKRPLQEGIDDSRAPHNHVDEDRETTPLLPSSTRSSDSNHRDRECCVVL